MSNTYRSQTRSHRLAVTSKLTSAKRAPAVQVGLECSATSTCPNVGVVIALRGIPPLLWPVICDEHRERYAAAS